MEFLIESASTYASSIDHLILGIGAIVGVWFLLAQGIFFYFIYKGRKKAGVKAKYVAGESHEEMKWIHIPHNAVLFFDVIVIIWAIMVWKGIKQDLPDADATVRVIGQQWSWTFVHPGEDGQIDTDDDVITVDELHVVANKNYHYKLESVDVLHDFSVPVFRLKQDAVPGRVITGWFNATKTGEHDVQCAEMCGIGHGIMQARIFIETEEQHAEWLASQSVRGRYEMAKNQ